MTEKRFTLTNDYFWENQKPISCEDVCILLNKLYGENEQLKQQISYYEKLITDKDVEWLRDNTVWEQIPTSKRTVTKITLSDKND